MLDEEFDVTEIEHSILRLANSAAHTPLLNEHGRLSKVELSPFRNRIPDDVYTLREDAGDLDSVYINRRGSLRDRSNVDIDSIKGVDTGRVLDRESARESGRESGRGDDLRVSDQSREIERDSTSHSGVSPKFTTGSDERGANNGLREISTDLRKLKEPYATGILKKSTNDFDRDSSLQYGKSSDGYLNNGKSSESNLNYGKSRGANSGLRETTSHKTLAHTLPINTPKSKFTGSSLDILNLNEINIHDRTDAKSYLSGLSANKPTYVFDTRTHERDENIVDSTFDKRADDDRNVIDSRNDEGDDIHRSSMGIASYSGSRKSSFPTNIKSALKDSTHTIRSGNNSNQSTLHGVGHESTQPRRQSVSFRVNGDEDKIDIIEKSRHDKSTANVEHNSSLELHKERARSAERNNDSQRNFTHEIEKGSNQKSHIHAGGFTTQSNELYELEKSANHSPLHRKRAMDTDFIDASLQNKKIKESERPYLSNKDKDYNQEYTKESDFQVAKPAHYSHSEHYIQSLHISNDDHESKSWQKKRATNTEGLEKIFNSLPYHHETSKDISSTKKYGFEPDEDSVAAVMEQVNDSIQKIEQKKLSSPVRSNTLPIRGENIVSKPTSNLSDQLLSSPSQNIAHEDILDRVRRLRGKTVIYRHINSNPISALVSEKTSNTMKSENYKPFTGTKNILRDLSPEKGTRNLPKESSPLKTQILPIIESTPIKEFNSRVNETRGDFGDRAKEVLGAHPAEKSVEVARDYGKELTSEVLKNLSPLKSIAQVERDTPEFHNQELEERVSLNITAEERVRKESLGGKSFRTEGKMQREKIPLNNKRTTTINDGNLTNTQWSTLYSLVNDFSERDIVNSRKLLHALNCTKTELQTKVRFLKKLHRKRNNKKLA